ncbi:hypothetical protein A2U01_0101668, partial [Trifolium medium]|nr:hypothetical protein [Trifolium medium]
FSPSRCKSHGGGAMSSHLRTIVNLLPSRHCPRSRFALLVYEFVFVGWFWLEGLIWAFGFPPRRRSEASYGLG